MSRRRFLRGAVAASAGSAALAVPGLAKALGPIVFRCQSGWPAKDPLYEHAQDLARKLNAMTGGDVKMDVLPVGSVVPASGLLESVAKGSTDCAHCAPWQHFHKHPAFGLWGSGPAFGMTANQLLAWHRYGGGRELLDKLHAAVGANVVAYLYGPLPARPLGWFKKPITRPDDFKGLRFRAVGPAAELFAALGAKVLQVPEEQIAAALAQGELDGTQRDSALAGPSERATVCMLQSYHASAEQLELVFNRDKFDALPAKLKAVVETAIEAASQEMLWTAVDRHSRTYAELSAGGKVRFAATPTSVLQRQLAAFDALAGKWSENALFREIHESQKAYARRLLRWDVATSLDRRVAYRHYFGAQAAKRGRKK